MRTTFLKYMQIHAFYIAHCTLHIAYCILHIAYCILHIAYCNTMNCETMKRLVKIYFNRAEFKCHKII